MKRRRQFAVLACLTVALLLAYPIWQRLTEPCYQGHSVRYWFKEFCKFGTHGFTFGPDGRHIYIENGVEVPDSGRDALRAIGEPAVAFLLKRVKSPALFNVPGYLYVYTNLPLSMRKILPNSDEREFERMQAMLALASMGKVAEPTIPTVIDYALKQPGDAPGLVALAFNLPASEMNRVLNGLALQGRYKVIRGLLNQRLVRSRTAAKLVGEILAQDKTSDVWPLQTLREIGADSIEALPVLLPMISSTNSEVRYQTVQALEAIGPAAADALPALKSCTLDPNPMVQSAARRAIQAMTAKPKP